MRLQTAVSTKCMDGVGELPGLNSVASATVASTSSSLRPGAHRGRPRKKSVACSRVNTVDAVASAAMADLG